MSESIQEKYSRGQLAKKSGVNSETIRYYEKIGLLGSPGRTEGGHRIYKRQHLKQITFIKRSRELGFTLKEIEGLQNLVDGGSYTCEEVRDLTIVHLTEVEQKIADLQKIQSTLNGLIKDCDGGLTPNCSIVDTLFPD